MGQMTETALSELLESLKLPEESMIDSMLQSVTAAVWDRVSMWVSPFLNINFLDKYHVSHILTYIMFQIL